MKGIEPGAIDRMLRFIKALEAINKLVGKQRGVSGRLDCPNCGKGLRYSVAASNGHKSGRCETKDCVNFIE